MNDERIAFINLVQRILDRSARQNGKAAWPAQDTAAIGERLWALISERGLPSPLPPNEMGAPGEMTPAEVAPLVARVLGQLDAPDLSKPVQQLVKACFYPEFKKCRESYHEIEADGTCRRQQWKRVRERVSGSHCVDCPYWLSLTPEQHEQFLAKAWVGDPVEWAAHRDGFLPEDFRALRSAVRKLAAARGR